MDTITQVRQVFLRYSESDELATKEKELLNELLAEIESEYRQYNGLYGTQETAP